MNHSVEGRVQVVKSNQQKDFFFYNIWLFKTSCMISQSTPIRMLNIQQKSLFEVSAYHAGQRSSGKLERTFVIAYNHPIIIYMYTRV